ncbi:ATP-binding protein [Georgenia wangjunii]|uniref:ATP-binding protein n=1 Tax=Georgenia wangjunii TaxID=3117730 RepID=UPI002F26B003
MSELPEGTLTLLFTDIEGSTRVLRELGSAYAEVLTIQRRILRAAFQRWGGHEMGTEGDSFFVVFTTARAALSAALQAQRELARVEWPGGQPVRVRMGMHTGEPVRHEDGYVGMDVHLAARVAGCAHGGQVVLSAATHRIAVHQVLAGMRFLDLGLHRLKDIAAPERLYQLAADGIEERFPPVRSLGAGASLPAFGSPLVGRDGELAELTAQLARVRVLTLTGPGGVGKTRLALAVASAREGQYADGVYFVPLAAVRSTDAMWTTIAEALGATGENKAPPTFLSYLGAREVLLVLDNVEQLPMAGDVVRELVDAGPGVSVLTTSRRPLHVEGEYEHPVPPLVLPGRDADVRAAEESGAVALFVERARMVRPGFSLTPENVGDVAVICQRLDGLPLAIELVAARAKLLGPRALRARLDESLEISAAGGARPERQRSLRAAIAWSYELLEPELRSVFVQLSVFDAEFDLEAVAAVVRPGEAPAGGGASAGASGAASAGASTGPEGTASAGAATADPLDLVGALVDANLLMIREGRDGEPRVRMLRTIATYARDLLRTTTDAEEVRRRHAEHYVGVAERLSPLLRSAQHVGARDRIEAELSNLRAALRWSLGAGSSEHARRPAPALATGLRLCEHLGWFWYACGYQAEGRQWLRLAVEAGAGRESREFVRALHSLGVLVLLEGSAAQAREILETCLDFWRRDGDAAGTAMELNSLALAHRALGDPEQARAMLTESLDLAREAGERRGQANALSNLAALETDAGEYDSAIERLREVLRLDTEGDDAWGMAADHVNLGGVLLRAGRLDEAQETLERHGPGAASLGDIELTVDVIELFCVLHAERGDARRAARLLGASEETRATAQLPLSEPDVAWLSGVLDKARAAVDPRQWAADVEDGRALAVEDALAEALAGSDVAR